MDVRSDYPQRRRRPVRLAGYDYSQAGAYFLTICTHGKGSLFGHVEAQEMHINAFGTTVKACWDDLPNHYPNVILDAFVVMPNHVHGILMLTGPGTAAVGAGLKPAPKLPPGSRGTGDDDRGPPKTTKPHPVSEIIRAFKTFSSRRINELRKTPGLPVWQRTYYEHVIRQEEDMNRIREYVVHNASRWAEDAENPERVRR